MYAKVFSQIFDSSIANNYKLRHFFTDLLVLAEIDGVVDMTPEAISARTRIPLKEVVHFLHELEQPDPRSRSHKDDGRRITKIDPLRDWGWQIINYAQYRQIASDEQRREKTKLRTKKWRESQQNGVCDAPVTLGDACDAMQRQRQRQRQREGNPQKSVAELSILDIKDVITAKKAQAQEIKHRFSSEVAMGTHWSDNKKREEHRSLRTEIKKLEGEIAQRA